MSNLCNLQAQLDALRATAKAAATVMGPDDTTLRSSIAEDTELLAAVRSQTLTGQQLADLIAERILEPARQSAQDQQQSAIDAIDKGFDTAKTNADRVTNSYVLQPRSKRAQAKITFDASIATVTDIVNKMAVVDKRLDRTTVKINALCPKGDSSDEDTDVTNNILQFSSIDNPEAAKEATNEAAAKAVILHTQAKLLEGYQTKREQLTKEHKQLQLQLFKHFEPMLGGISSVTKYDKNKLSIPTLNNKVRAREIIDAFKSYMAHRATEYYAVLPYMNYVADRALQRNPKKRLTDLSTYVLCPPLGVEV